MIEFNTQRVSCLIDAVEESLTITGAVADPEKLVVGVDLGTAYIVLVVLDHHGHPLATEMQFAQVLKDGLVVDYVGALTIVRELKEKLEARLQVTLDKAAIAMPSNSPKSVCKTHRYVVEGAGMDVINMLDEPTAANLVLGISNGAVVDIGGGTTGLSVFKDGKVIYTADEATGGTHLTLVLAGHYKKPFEEAEGHKKNSVNHSDVVTIVRPVIEKMGSIVRDHIQGHNVENIYLVGGTTCLPEFEQIVEKQTGVPTHKPDNPFLVTPLGIALSALEKISIEGCTE